MHLVAQVIGAVTPASSQAEVLFVKFVVVVVQVAQRHETLALVLVHLHVEAELRNTGDGALEGLAQVLLHVLHLLVLDAGALCLCCRLFGIGALLA